MGGMKSSGLGRRHGAEGLLRYTESKTVAAQAGWLGFEPPFDLTAEAWAGVLAGTLKAMRRLGVR
jgi:aldehyde dehydrogenase (NAD+)/succinate-semialdehyde dehydrogenase/glutarate-semialdehyde dehydrogenase